MIKRQVWITFEKGEFPGSYMIAELENDPSATMFIDDYYLELRYAKVPMNEFPVMEVRVTNQKGNEVVIANSWDEK